MAYNSQNNFQFYSLTYLAHAPSRMRKVWRKRARGAEAFSDWRPLIGRRVRTNFRRSKTTRAAPEPANHRPRRIEFS